MKRYTILILKIILNNMFSAKSNLIKCESYVRPQTQIL